MDQMSNPEHLRDVNAYEFDWTVLHIIIGGQSAIDSNLGFNIRTAEQALKFLECYGYDSENPIEKAELFGNFQEALNFIRRHFLQPDNPNGLKLEIPRKIVEMTDVVQLLMLTQTPADLSPSQQTLSFWACAVIKVMHTIAHMDKDLRSHYFTDIQTQILDRFYKFIHSDEKNQVFLGKDIKDPDRIDLVLFDSKPKKGRDSVLLKLLHKPENVAEDIFDRVGLRFVTKNRFDCLRIVKFLKERYILMPANIKPSRSKNTLINLHAFTQELHNLKEVSKIGQVTPADFYQKLVQFCKNSDIKYTDLDNPHSSSFYKTIQFTVRQLIKIQNPLYEDLKVLKASIKGKPLPEDILKITDKIDLKNLQKEIRFFYPFEVQICDEESHQENVAGLGSHSSYKKSQLQTALLRVMGDLTKLNPEHLCDANATKM